MYVFVSFELLKLFFVVFVFCKLSGLFMYLLRKLVNDILDIFFIKILVKVNLLL